jgi:hypothetical protein
MQDKAAVTGLAVDPFDVDADGYRGVLTDSYSEFLKGLYARKNPRHYRAIRGTKFGHEIVDPSVQKRRKEDREYEPQNDGLPPLD